MFDFNDFKGSKEYMNPEILSGFIPMAQLLTKMMDQLLPQSTDWSFLSSLVVSFSMRFLMRTSTDNSPRTAVMTSAFATALVGGA